MNPFSYGIVVKGENFYDRQQEYKRITETLAGGNNLNDGIIDRTGNEYFISDPFFKIFLKDL